MQLVSSCSVGKGKGCKGWLRESHLLPEPRQCRKRIDQYGLKCGFVDPALQRRKNGATLKGASCT